MHPNLKPLGSGCLSGAHEVLLLPDSALLLLPLLHLQPPLLVLGVGCRVRGVRFRV